MLGLDFHVRIRSGFSNPDFFSEKLVTQRKAQQSVSPIYSLDFSELRQIISRSYLYYFISDTQTATNFFQSPKPNPIMFGMVGLQSPDLTSKS